MKEAIVSAGPARLDIRPCLCDNRVAENFVKVSS